MKFLATLLLIAAPGAWAACPDAMNRDPSFLTLAVPEGAPRPRSAADFGFIDDTTTLEVLTARVGPPDAAKGEHTFLYCLPDGVVISIATRTGSDIRTVRANGKVIYKRK